MRGNVRTKYFRNQLWPRYWLLLPFCLLITLPSGSTADPTPWYFLENGHLRVLTNASEQKSAQIFHTLEKFRVASQNVVRVQHSGKHRKVLIILFAEFAEFKKYRRGVNVAGYAILDNDEPMLVMPAEFRSYDVMLIAKHELVHALMVDHPVRFPLWYREGIAELLSTMEISDGHFVLGKPHGERAFSGIKPIPFHRVLKNTFPTHRPTLTSDGGDPYFQYWLLTHYLLLGAPAELKEKLAPYLQQVHAGADPVDIFESSFGIALRSLWRKHLRPYWKKLPQFESTFDTGALELNYVTSPASSTQISETLKTLEDRRR